MSPFIVSKDWLIKSAYYLPLFGLNSHQNEGTVVGEKTVLSTILNLIFKLLYPNQKMSCYGTTT
jgi:hypothetical protein